MKLRSEKRSLFGELLGVGAGTQDTDEDEVAWVQLHGAHDEVRVARGNVGAV